MIAGQERALPVVVKGACPHDCPDTCAWQVTVENGVAVNLAGDKDHPFTRGGLCAKVNHYLERATARTASFTRCGERVPKGQASSRRSAGMRRSTRSPVA